MPFRAEGETPRVSAPGEGWCPVDRQGQEQQKASARRGRVGRLPGALAPRWSSFQRSALAGAMAPAIEAVKVPSPLRAGTGNAPRFPARARRCPVDRQVREQRQASARPGGREAPARGGAGAGRGLWPPAGGQRWHRMAWAMATAGPREARAEEVPLFQPAVHAPGTFSRPSHQSRTRRRRPWGSHQHRKRLSLRSLQGPPPGRRPTGCGAKGSAGCAEGPGCRC